MENCEAHKSFVCDKIRFWNQSNRDLMVEHGELERIDLAILQKILDSEYKIYDTITGN